MLNTVIFDIGRVLVHFEWREYLESFGFTQEINDAIGSAVFQSEAWNELDLGSLKDDEILSRFIDAAPSCADRIRQVMRSFPSAITMMPYACDWVRTLKSCGLRVYYLSNYGRSTRRDTQTELAFLDLMDGGLMSYEVHRIKPDPAFYQALFERYQILPGHAVFLDDNAENIAAAKKLGLHTILFTDYPSAKQELKQRFQIET